MALLAAAFGASATTGGLQAAFWLDTPTGPTIVSLAAILFALSSLAGRVKARAMKPRASRETLIYAGSQARARRAIAFPTSMWVTQGVWSTEGKT